MNKPRVVVVGAGLSGLAVAARLLDAGQEVLVLEAGSGCGGQIQTEREGELLIELGAEGFVARSRAVPALCALVGLTGSLVDQLTTDTYCLEVDELRLLPAGEAARRLGFQVPDEELGRGIRSLSGGMGELVAALARRIGPERLRLQTRVESLAPVGRGFQIQLADSVEGAGTLVLSVPAREAARLLQPLAIEGVAPLETAPLLSSVSVNLLFRRGQFQRYPAGSGLLFPAAFASLGLRACSFVEQKFAGRVPEGSALVRLFFRPSPEALAAWTDPRWQAEAATALSQVLPFTGAPERVWVTRWQDALPVFAPAYLAQVSAADEALQKLSIHLAGSAFHGAGIDAAATSAETVAARLLTR